MRGDDLFRKLEAENPLPPMEAAEIDAPYIVAMNVTRIRNARGMSLDALAAIGVAKSRIAQIERGDANLRIGTLARLAVALESEMHDVLVRQGASNNRAINPLEGS